MENGKRRVLARLRVVLGFAMGVVGAGMLVSSAGAFAQSAPVPAAWISYAQLVGEQFQSSLETQGAAADQLHTYLEQRIVHPPGDAPPAAIVVRAWLGADGAVTRLAFDSLGDAQADANLRALLSAHPITAPPPADMRQPLRVRLRLEENPEAAPQQGAGAAS
ncbi:YbaB/EbfC family DNA-binding protein [Paraburkholderia jirisanensis]